jgi:MFS family permease
VNVVLAAAAALVSFAFMLSTLDRWLRRRRPHELAWTVSLGLFCIGASALWWAEANGWTIGTFRVFFFAGAIANVPWLALGTVYLLAGERRGRRTQRCIEAFTWLAAGVMLVAPTKIAVSGDELPTGKEVFGVAPRVLAAVGSGVAALVIFAGAAWSAYRLLRKQPPSDVTARAGITVRAGNAPRRLAFGNILIALGTIVLSASGTLAGRLGKDQAFAVTLLVGISILFAGFLVSPSSRRSSATLSVVRDAPVRATSDAAASR